VHHDVQVLCLATLTQGICHKIEYKYEVT
jgi:hypothetical protein